MAAAGLGVVAARLPALVETDQEQARLDRVAATPTPQAALRQTFVAAHDGLSAVELVAVLHPNIPADGKLVLRLRDAAGKEVASREAEGFAHNDPLRLDFTPVSSSRGERFTIEIEGRAGNRGSVWAYGLDGYRPGELTHGGVPAAGDLRFQTYATLCWSETWRPVAAGLGQTARTLLPLWLVLFAPGLLLVDLLPRGADPSPRNFWTRWGLALGFSLALVALLWLWGSVAGLRWSAARLAVVYALCGLPAATREFSRALAGWRSRRCAAVRQPDGARGWLAGGWGHAGALASILAASLALRFLAVRDVVLPLWVDSPHHLLIVKLLAAGGRIPESYEPLVAVDPFSYHFGFHALAVTFSWFTGLESAVAVLLLGQVLNGLVPLAIYALVATLASSPRAGIAAAFFTALVSIFPAHYVAWGRYTQLTGIVILAAALAAVWILMGILMENAAGGGAAAKSGVSAVLPTCIAAGFLASGLLLTHYRVFFFFVTFVVALALVAAWDLRPGHAPGSAAPWYSVGLSLTGTAALAAFLALPWIMRLLTSEIAAAAAAPARLASPAGYNVFPLEYLSEGAEKMWMGAAVVCLLWGAARRNRLVLVTGIWIGLTALALNVGPGSWVVNNNSWAISLFVPGAILLGWGAERTAAWAGGSPQVRPWPRVLRFSTIALATGLAAFAAARGVRANASAGELTRLAYPADLEALRWIAAETPVAARFWIRGWEWQARAWAGADGGTWILPFASRASTLPPLDYAFEPALRMRVNAENARLLSAAENPGAAETLALLRELAVTHVYIGARAGRMKPELFLRSPAYHLIYSNGAAWVFEVRKNAVGSGA